MESSEIKLTKRVGPGKWGEIRKRYEAGEQSKLLAAEYGIAPETIARRATKEGWKKARLLKAEAITEFYEEIKTTWRERVAEATDTEIKVYKLGASICVQLLRDLKEGKCVGRRAYEAKAVLDGLHVCITGIRTALQSDQINLFDDDVRGRNQTAGERLAEIFDQMRTRFPDSDSEIDPDDTLIN